MPESVSGLPSGTEIVMRLEGFWWTGRLQARGITVEIKGRANRLGLQTDLVEAWYAESQKRGQALPPPISS